MKRNAPLCFVAAVETDSIHAAAHAAIGLVQRADAALTPAAEMLANQRRRVAARLRA